MQIDKKMHGPVAKQYRANAETISEFILAHPYLRHLLTAGQVALGCLGLWAFTWVTYFAFGAF